MRFMMMMIPGVYQGEKGRQVKGDFAPTAEAVERMTKYNEELAKAGVLISLDGLLPPSTAARVSFPGGKARVTDGPFTESKEVLGGYWMIDVKSREEAVEWAKKVPADEGDVIEVRQVSDVEEWPEDVKKAAMSHVLVEELKKGKKS